jgi:hypothetical protein
MTFAQYVLKTRERLYDVRDASGVLITDAATDGIRWSSVLLQEVCTSAIHQLIRILVSLDLFNYYNESSLTISTTGLIKKLTGDIEVTPVVAGEKIYKIVRIQEVGERAAIYDYVKPDMFFTDVYKISLDEDNKSYTTVYDAANTDVVGKSNYIPVTADVPINVIYKRTIDTLLDITLSGELPFLHLNDLMLDFAEEQGRLIEHNPTQLQSVQTVIKSKLELLALERKK